MRFFLFLLLVAGVVLGVRYGPGYWKEYRQKSRSLDHLCADVSKAAEMLEQARTEHEKILLSERRTSEPNPSAKPTGKISGNPLFICLQKNDNDVRNQDRFGDPYCVDFLTHQLPGELKPETEDEVGTLIGLTWSDRYKGGYGATGATADSGSLALVETCEIDVIEKKTGKLIARAKAYGGQPPNSVGMAPPHDISGAPANAQILDFVKSLFLPEHQLASTVIKHFGTVDKISPP